MDWPEAGSLGCVSESGLGSGGELGSRFAGFRVVMLNAYASSGLLVGTKKDSSYPVHACRKAFNAEPASPFATAATGSSSMNRRTTGSCALDFT